MTFLSINPATGKQLASMATWHADQIESVLARVAAASAPWADTPLADRCALLRRLAAALRQRQDELASLITNEMGKLLRESRAEVEKCALACDYYADMAPEFLADETLKSDASRSYIQYQPLGTVLAIMPWNFPLWQVFRFAAPALAAGNTALLKHAANVSQCALAIESVFTSAGFPDDVFRTLLINAEQVSTVIADLRVHAVTLTGSERAGRSVAASAGQHLKKTVLELGGSDPFIVLADANLELAVSQALISRYQNAGQSCIAAKRFIVVDAIADAFIEAFTESVRKLTTGDPLDEQTTLAPLARHDLRDSLHAQVSASIDAGAVAICGCRVPNDDGAYYPASILDHVSPGIPAFDEELFGPVASIVRAADETDALQLANQSRFGLGGSVWTKDRQRGEQLARAVQSGACFVNGMVKSDPRLPFGGIKASGYGRELSYLGIREFVNAKTVWLR